MKQTAYFKHYHVTNHVKGWKEAIYLAAKPMLEQGWVTENYVGKMINNVVENGPYIVIMPHVALPHTRSEDGALATSISIVKLVEPVLFPEDKEVKLVIAFSAHDNDTHMKLLSSLVDVLMDNDVMNQTLKCSDVDQLKDVFCV